MLDLMYMRGGPVPDQPQEISRIMGVSVRKWKSLRADLLAVGKIYEFEGHLSNERVDRELPERIAEGGPLSENGRKGGKKRAENCSRVARELSESCSKRSDKNAENEGVDNENNNLGEKRLENKGPKHPSILETRDYIDKKNIKKELEILFSEFWLAFPKSVGKSVACKSLAKAIADTEFKIIMDGLKQAKAVWDDAATQTQFIPNASTWLGQRRWEDFEASEPTEEIQARREEILKQAKYQKLRMKVKGILRAVGKWGGGTQDGFTSIAKELDVDLSMVNQMAESLKAEALDNMARPKS